jgi:hypothetical protein
VSALPHAVSRRIVASAAVERGRICRERRRRVVPLMERGSSG